MPASDPPDLRQLRVDHIGSLKRPRRLQEAATRLARGEISADALRAVQDAAIREVIAQQEAHRLPVVNDGEFRRDSFMHSFGRVAGWDWSHGSRRTVVPAGVADSAAGATPAPLPDSVRATRQTVTEPLRLLSNQPLAEYRFAQRAATRPVKVTLLNSDRLRQLYDAEGSRSVYPTARAFQADVVRVQREIVAGLVDAGCPYIQLDAPSYTRFIDPASLADLRAAGEDPRTVLQDAIDGDNAVMRGFERVTFGVHVCRGNSPSGINRSGLYEDVAEVLFSQLTPQRLLLEYDDERQGSFAPLRFVPKDVTVVLGLISTKRSEVESVDFLLRRIDEATRYVPVERLALSPQCGFKNVDEDLQWRKLDVMLEAAARVWGV
jgi:5-methyltetrahydropteroyltriglutamate--homocysteine methyltransferase